MRTRVEQLTRRIGSLESASLEQVLPLYSLLERLAANDGIDPNEPPAGFGFGLFQGPRLARSAEQAYREMLDRSLAPLLIKRLRRDLREAEDSAARYEALRASLMLTTPQRLVRGELRRWVEQALAQASGAGERAEWARHVDALLERNGLPEAMRPDDAGVSAARGALAALPLSQRVHERLLRRVSDPEPPQDLPTRLGAASALTFAASSAGPMPAHSSARDWRRNLVPALEATFDELANEADWVLGDAGREVRRLQKDRAWRDEIGTQVGKRQAQRVIAAWSRQLDALALAPGTDADGATAPGNRSHGPDSPLRRLFTRLADEFGATSQGGSTAEAAFDDALRARFGALGDYAAGAGPQALDRLHALATGKRDEAANAELDATLRAEAARAPASLRKVYIDLGTLIRSRGGAKPGFDAALAELAQTCSALTRERFPFGAAASRDMAPSDFARLFGPGGLFDEFRRNQLAERVDTSSRPWKARGAAADASMPGTFEQAAAIGALFFPGGAQLPELKLRLTPQRMDAQLLQFSIDVDGQLLRFENGPPRAKELTLAGTGFDAESADAYPAARRRRASAPRSMKARSPGFGYCCAATGRASEARRHGWPLPSTHAPSKSRRAHPARPTPISGRSGSWRDFAARKQNGEAAAASRLLVGQAARRARTSSAAACRHAGAATGTAGCSVASPSPPRRWKAARCANGWAPSRRGAMWRCRRPARPGAASSCLRAIV